MSFSQPDLYRLCATSSCASRFPKSQASHTCQRSTDPLRELSCDHWRFCEKVSRRSPVKAKSLGSPVGLVCSNATMANCRQKAGATARNFATYLKAFALIYVLPEADWTAEKIDMLLEQGLQLYRCSSKTYQSEDEDREENQLVGTCIYTNEEKRIKRKFILEGHTFTMALEPRYLGETSRPHIMKNLRFVLQAFFKSSRYCLLLTRVGHLLVWKRRKAYFVLDVKGRRRDDLQCDKDNGVAMLVCLKGIDNVVYLASNLSGIRPTDVFTIRELVVVRLKTPDGQIYLRDSSYRSVEFKVVNRSYAYLKATFHLSYRQYGTVKNCSSLMVAVGSILASKIDHPANWDTNMLDRLICYGVELCCSRWSDCLREGRSIRLDTFPTQLRLGQFVVGLKVMPGLRFGHWDCDLDIVKTDFEANFREILEEFGNVVFQINNQMYAMWVKNDFYYLFDPYRHTIVGTHVKEDQCTKWATLRMFRDRLTMLSVFHQLLRESNGQSVYYLHAVRIRNIAECPQGFIPSPLPEERDTCDVESLNEPILFSNQLGTTVQEHCLAEISDCDCDKEDGADIDLRRFKIYEERQCGGAAQGKVMESQTRVRTSVSQKPITATPEEASKPSTRNSKTINNTNKTETARDQSAGKKPKVTFQESKRYSAEVSKRKSSNHPSKKHVEITRKPATKYETDFKRQTGGTKGLANSTAISKAGSRSGKNPKWTAKESATIRLGTKVASSKLLPLRDVSIGAPSPSIQPSKEHTTSEDATMTESGTISPQTAIRDAFKESMGSSNALTPVGKTSFSTSVLSGTGRQAGQTPLQIPSKLDNAEPRKSGRCRSSERIESLNRYPGYSREPQLLAVAGSESGTVESLNRLLSSAFKVANRVLAMTPWGNYVVFRHCPDSGQGSACTWFFLFDGCTCNIDRFRHLDLSIGTAGLIAFRKLSEVVCHMIDSRQQKAINLQKSRSRGNDCSQH